MMARFGVVVIAAGPDPTSMPHRFAQYRTCNPLNQQNSSIELVVQQGENVCFE